jgi:hypothetical protein
MHGAVPPLPHYAFMAWCLVKHRDNFTFTFTLQMSIEKEVYKSIEFTILLIFDLILTLKS